MSLVLIIIVIVIIFGLGWFLGLVLSFHLLESKLKGEPGPMGPAGSMGVRGPRGYSPVKGLDYFTEEDKQEIINEIIKMMEDKENGCNGN